MPRHYDLLTSLPALGELGSPAPLTLRDLLERAERARRGARLVEALLLSDDLMQRQAVLAGETEDIAPAVLTAAQVRGQTPLPEALGGAAGPAGGAEASSRDLTDAVWEAYFRYAAAVAAEASSEFLAQWVGFEVALRNALAAARAAALGIEVGRGPVAADLAGDEPMDRAISDWSAAADPLTAQRSLDAARWAWLHQHDRYFSFSDDELAAYAAKLMLLVRWQRITK